MEIADPTPVTLLTPVPGSPGPGDSSIGGPLLWPADDPWPRCFMPDERDRSGRNACALVPVVQLYRRDVPGGWWHGDTDLFQVLWCPNEHVGPSMAGQPEQGPLLHMEWRRVAETEGRGQLTPVAPVRSESWLVPRACLIGIEEAVEPARAPISRPGVWKAGGGPRWRTPDGDECVCGDCFTCANCYAPMDLLLTVSSGDATGVVVSGGGELRIFGCRTDPEDSYAIDLY
ncbi:hypothetical protein OG898_16690 [Streptomyces sp. NBC_00193]|uniref:hypothetical protein n=1 Tax=unclassified Streptomyces TaxID=2593676 RepID=UPI0022574406|nr:MULTISPECIES: hypothetical protein [unclassified Streptomyces]MCX5126098.1 hypothetical protein [Streptomyces sp. NBC_00347]MCX5298103.1 hypothetical protein [Streptomyces sp. NBC_00193]